MKFYESNLKKRGFDVHYIDSKNIRTTSEISEFLRKDNISKVFFAELDDDWLDKKLKASLKKAIIKFEEVSSPSFLTELSWSNDFFEGRKDYFQTSFYIAQRKRLNILIEDNSPVGGSWTFDKDNRKKLPKGHILPKVSCPKANSYVLEAEKYININFPSNYGTAEGLIYPVTHKDAKACLDEFINIKLTQFGDFQDAISSEESFLYHSLLSAPINAGLLTPEKVISKVLEANIKNKIPLNSLEGFIRQIIGWREYFRAIYKLESVHQRTHNFFGYKRKIPESFWTGETGILPIDNVISKVLKNSYAHHIERLMVLGNFMLLAEFDPDDVYLWFMEIFIDAYDWVMVPNVYGMSQYADGGLITTKPYVSSSNYIKKMSDFKGSSKSGDWCEIWDGLYWNFIDNQRDTFKNNRRMSLMIKQLEKMSPGKLKTHKNVASNYLASIS